MQFDVTFPAIPCTLLSLDAMDISGERHLDIVCCDFDFFFFSLSSLFASLIASSLLLWLFLSISSDLSVRYYFSDALIAYASRAET